jgi:hypothetical protein
VRSSVRTCPSVESVRQRLPLSAVSADHQTGRRVEPDRPEARGSSWVLAHVTERPLGGTSHINRQRHKGNEDEFDHDLLPFQTVRSGCGDVGSEKVPALSSPDRRGVDLGVMLGRWRLSSSLTPTTRGDRAR